MKTTFFPKLALEGIRKNQRLYYPYIFTGCIVVMMCYILNFLSDSPVLDRMSGGATLGIILPLGSIVIVVFSVLLLFYTNSFLMKQRYREFGLYNILGMDKKNICRLMVWETLFVGAAAMILGLLSGIVLAKLAELGLINLLKLELDYTLRIGVPSLRKTAALYAAIYLLILLDSVIRVLRSKPLELMQTSKVGERVPKRTWLFALVGVALLALAYYLAVTINDPLDALIVFFVAVLLVIMGTYLVFISGSVVLCKLLQANKRYYYRPNHFVSVSSMVYRMKRNGAGLASICILLTMVLVMITSTSCLYFGAEDSLAGRCPNSINISMTFDSYEGVSEENLELFRGAFRETGGDDADLQGFRACQVPGILTKSGILIDIENANFFDYSTYRSGFLNVVSLSDYNHLMGEHKTLSDGECLMYCSRLEYQSDTFCVEHCATYRIREMLSSFRVDGETLAMTMPVVYLVVADLDAFAAPFRDLRNRDGVPIMMYDWNCGFDLADSNLEKAALTQVNQAVMELAKADENSLHLYSREIISRSGCRESYYELYGGLFFLGIMLSIVFLIAAVMIIYYKQISEGFEDSGRFDIMQKVGMTKEDIRKSINSQMLTVFYLPLVMAGVHLAFAFPFVSKILLVFAFNNTLLSILVNVACFAAFGVFYAVVYKITSGAYFAIVSGRHDA